MSKFSLLVFLSLSSLAAKESKLELKKLGVKTKDSDRLIAAPPRKISSIEGGMKKLDEQSQAEGLSIRPNDELLKSLYDNKGHVLKSLTEFDFTTPPINAEYVIKF